METNQNGCTLERSYHSMRDRYYYDVHLRTWEQYHTPQDAWYHGVWINRDTRQIFSYTEGDELMVTAPTADGSPRTGAGCCYARWIPLEGDYADGLLAPSEHVDVPFDVCLENPDLKFRSSK